MKPGHLDNCHWKRTAFLVFSAFLIIGCQRSNAIPEYAEVWVDDNAREYVSPPCLSDMPNLRLRFIRRSTMGEMHATFKDPDHSKRYNPEHRCRDQGGFMDEFVIWPFPLPPSRVDSNGKWLW